MKRSHILLSALAAVLLCALFYVLLYQPAREELAVLEVQIADEQHLQVGLTQEIDRLQSVRETAPETEAQLAAAEAVVPTGANLPSALRQLQLAADESGVILQAVATGRPDLIVDGPAGLSSVASDVQLVGGYFQIVDFLRRVEDPAITPRGMTWETATLSRGEYPNLDVALSGSMYAFIDVPVPPEPEIEPTLDEDGEVVEDVESDVEVEVEPETEEPA